MALGFDPRRHGFPIIKNLHNQIKNRLLPRSLSPHEWIRIQQGADENSDQILDEFKDLLLNFRRLKFIKRARKPDYGQRVKCGTMKVTTRLPKRVREIILQKYYRFKYLKQIELPSN
jgi:hypothetical protein